MNKKIFKYETRNGKTIRLKDILILFSAFALCIITALVTNSVENKKVSYERDSMNKEVLVAKNTEELNETVSQKDVKIFSDAASKDFILKFVKPVDGTVIKPFSPKDLLFSKTMDDWRIHLGVDVACPLDSEITSAEKGIVKSVKYDINYGNTVIVESGEYTVSYASLSSDIKLSEGQQISKGDLIGVLSDSCMAEICDEPHLHIEMTKQGEYVDPMDYIHFN